jgi:tripartite-type tricarboxylate transporter receptor subunit TctC
LPRAGLAQCGQVIALGQLGCMSMVEVKGCMKTLAHVLLLGVLLALGTAGAAAQSYPNRTVRIVVPFASGTAPDVLARLLGQKLSSQWGQPVIVENRQGANNIIGTDVVAKSAPDGYTLLVANDGAIAINPTLYHHLPYDSVNDFAPITLAVSIEMLLVSNPSLPVKSVRELIALAKERPGQLAYASGGNGSVPHVNMEMFKSMAGVDIFHVPYNSTSQLPAVISGQIPLLFTSLAAALPYIQSGQLRALAVANSERSAALPDVPTMAEAGVPGFSFLGWMGVLAPRGIPADILKKLNADIRSALNSPEVKDKLEARGLNITTGTPEQFVALIKSDTARLGKVVREAKIQLD